MAREPKQMMLPEFGERIVKQPCGCDDKSKTVIEIDSKVFVEMIVPLIPGLVKRYGLHD